MSDLEDRFYDMQSLMASFQQNFSSCNKILKSMKKIDGVRHVCCAPEDTCNFEYCSLSDDPQVIY